MNTNMHETLNAAIEQLCENKPIPDVLQNYPEKADELLGLLQTVKALESIAPVEMPSHEALQSDKNAYLLKIAQFKNSTVSPGYLARIKGLRGPVIHWPQNNLPYIRKENWNMGALLAKVVLMIGLLFGATGGVYAMAEKSLPNEPMYTAKLAMEQVQLNMASDPAKIAAQHLVIAQNRVQEIVRLAQKGTPPDAATMTRLENHLNTSLLFAAQLEGDGELLVVLAQARVMVQEQQREMNQLQVGDGDPLQDPLQQTLRLLNQFQEQVEAGLEDPQAFRWQYQYGQHGNPSAPGQPGGNPDCPLDECVPDGDQNQYGQSGEDAPGQPGGNPDCPLDECVPDGDQNQYGQSNEDAPGQPGGNPDCPNCVTEDCDPIGDENHNGPQLDQPGPGQPGGNPDCPTGDCEPIGDQNGPNKP